MNKKMSLSADSLSKTYGTKKVVDDVSIKVAQSEIVGLLGPNGAGKTTTFYSIVGLIKPDSGIVHIGSENITKLPMYKRARKGIGYLAQEASVFRNLSVRDNILAVIEGTGLSKIEQKDRVDSLLNEFSLEGIQHNMGGVLSGGERRRTEIARALAKEPKFILLDEPFAGVDPIAVEEIQNIVYSLKKKNIGILITDHNVRETLEIVDRAYILHEGAVIMKGTPEQVVNNESVKEVYLGREFKF